MTEPIRLDLDVLLPDAVDACDACTSRLTEELAAQGYVGFALDMYGKGVFGASIDGINAFDYLRKALVNQERTSLDLNYRNLSGSTSSR